MAKLNLKAGAKLDMTVRRGTGELTLKTSFVKETSGVLHLSMPMTDGKSYTPETDAPMILAWSIDGTDFTLDAVSAGTVKAGIRTYLVAKPAGDVQRSERRAFTRVPAEIDVEITSFDTGAGGTRVKRLYPGRTSDISGGGLAVYTDAAVAVGETIDIALLPKGSKRQELRAAVCWTRPAPKHAGYRTSVGFQFFFLNNNESVEVAKLVAAAAAKR